MWMEISRRHTDAILGIEHFEAFGDELVNLIVERGSETVMARTGVLPEGWGSFHDEDGEPLDEDLLRAGAEAVAEQRLRHDVGTLSSGLDTAITMGKVLGRLCSRTEATVWGDPTGDALEAVIELAVFALWVSTAGRSADRAEREFEHALRLTQSVAHGRLDELRDQPGDANWEEWLEVLIASVSDIIESACNCRLEADTELHALGAEHHHTPEEMLELAARSLLTSCLQALALFSGAVRE
jgi:hypothetical protein